MKKKSILYIFLILTAFKISAQQDSIQKIHVNEIKINAFNLIAFTAVDLSYEYLLNENQSLGLGLLFKLKPVKNRMKNLLEPEISYRRNFSLTFFYRYFFSRKYAKGIFIEGFAMYAAGKEFEEKNNSVESIDEFIVEKNKIFSLGIGVGFKIVNRKNLTIDANFGVGIRPSSVAQFSTISTTRGGVSFGCRF